MAVRPKTKHRLFILLAALIVLGAVGAGFYVVRMQYRQRYYMQARADGIVAFDNGDYEDAALKLAQYLRHHQDDAEALYLFAQARRQAESEGGQHIVQAMRAYRRVLSMQPDHDDARRQLLDLYTDAGYATEAMDTAEVLLDADPDDTDALRAKTIALMRLRRPNDALVPAERYNELKPLDMDGHMRTFAIMRVLERPVSEFLERAQAVSDANSDDPRAELLMAVACQAANQKEKAIEWCRKAAGREAPDAAFVTAVADRLAGLGLPGESLAVLRRADETGDDQDVLLALVRQLWEIDRYDEIMERLADLKPASGVDAELLALKALALMRAGKDQDATPIAQALAQRKNDLTAAAWAPILKSLADPEARPTDLIDACSTALSYRPNRAYFHYFLGQAYLAAGEKELATTSWGK